MNKLVLTENDINNLVCRCMRRILEEGYIDDTYESDSFKKWFMGSKIVDENGKPLLLGHATRSFGFSKFNTPLIHLSTINDASFFSGGSRRLFKYKNTLSKLSEEEVIDLYNKYFSYNGNFEISKVTDSAADRILSKYDSKIQKLSDPDEIKKLQKYDIDAENERKLAKICKNLFLKKLAKNPGQMCFVINYNGLPRLYPAGEEYTNKKSIMHWLSVTFLTVNQLRKNIIDEMFANDGYVGKGGTYALCARVLNPLHVDCQGATWDNIYIKPECEAYDGLFEKYCENGMNKNHYSKGSWFSLDNETIAYFAKELGYDGVIFHNIREGALGEAFMRTTFIVFSTKQLKSPFENNGEFGDVENLFK